MGDLITFELLVVAGTKTYLIASQGTSLILRAILYIYIYIYIYIYTLFIRTILIFYFIIIIFRDFIVLVFNFEVFHIKFSEN